jgi:3-phenylpropionate/trans-cinnamate dioxygenase ferredoxin subunit
MTREYVLVAKDSEIPEGETRIYDVEGTRIALCRVEGRLYAVEDRCSHDDGPLGEGYLEGYEIECPRHGARFDVRTGSVCRMPAVVPVEAFPVRVEDDDVYVEVDVD